jgi:hypothetical protein
MVKRSKSHGKIIGRRRRSVKPEKPYKAPAPVPTKPRRVKPLPAWQSGILKALEAKYGQDFNLMTADIKKNPYQWTKKQLETKFKLI